MNWFIIFSCVTLLVNATSHDELWKEFKNKHNKTYRNSIEEKLRFQIFKDNLRKIEEHNAKYNKGEVSWYMGINKFADTTQAEFEKWLNLHSGFKPNLEGLDVHKFDKNIKVPGSLDWREKGAVLEVKDQGACGSCWAFSATGTLEGQNFLVNNKSVSLSEQNLVDCSASWGNLGCDGGIMVQALNYVIVNGIQSEADYPYVGDKGGGDYYKYCVFDSSKVVLQAKNAKKIESTEEDLLQSIAHVGPISIGIDATMLSFYEGGLFDDEYCYNYNGINHGVLAIGYGTENDIDYFLVKNSWGAEWGEDGYFRIRRNSGVPLGLCGLASQSSFAVL